MAIVTPFFGELDETEYRDYQKQGAIGGSALSTIYKQSPAHYAEARTRKPSAAMLLGTAAHTLILEPHKWTSEFFTGRAVQRRTFPDPIKCAAGWDLGDGSPPYKTKKAALEAMGADRPWTVAGSDATYRTKKEAEAAIEEIAEGRHIVSEADELVLYEIVNDIWSHPIAGELLHRTTDSKIGTFHAEHALLWYDDEHAIDCSGKLDGLLHVKKAFSAHGLDLAPGEIIGIDLKTTGKPISPDGYARRCLDSGWHMQAAHYMAGAKAAGVHIDRWMNVVVETSRPHGVRVVELSPMMLELGKIHRAEALKAWKGYLDRKPGATVYDPAPLMIEPPAWAMPARETDWSAWIAGVEASDRASKGE